MIITCDQCNKKFEIESKLIPSEGRLLQCGSCEHKWFFKSEIVEDESIVLNNQIEDDDVTENKTFKIDQNLDYDKETTKAEKINKKKDLVTKKTPKKISILNLILVFIISFVAVIILAETFKSSLAKVFPNVDLVLKSLYETVKDIILFLKDLF